MKDPLAALDRIRGSGDPFEDTVDPELLKIAEARARAIREAEQEESPDISDELSDMDEVSDVKTDPVAKAPPKVMPEAFYRSSVGASLSRARISSETPREKALREASLAGQTVEGVITSSAPQISSLPKAPISRPVAKSAAFAPSRPSSSTPTPSTSSSPGPAVSRLQKDYETAKSLGFPERPKAWPSFMVWPPVKLMRHFMSDTVSEDQRRAMISKIRDTETKMLIRGQQIKKYLDDHGAPKKKKKKNILSLISPRRDKDKDKFDPYDGIKWASLVNPGRQDHAVTQKVVTWGRCTAATQDGGSLRVTDDAISFCGKFHGSTCVTPQAMALAMSETSNRGWGSVKMQGSYEFGMMAIAAAREANVEAEITYYGKGLLSWRTYTINVMPNLPLPELPHLEDAEKAASQSKEKYEPDLYIP